MTKHVLTLLSAAVLITACDNSSAVDCASMPLTCRDAGAAMDSGAMGDDAGSADSDAGVMAEAELVIDAAWLSAHIDDANLQIVDARDAASYMGGHIVGALNVSPGEVRATVDGVGGQLAPAGTVTDVFANAGLNASSRVVVYGSASEPATARVLWTLVAYGHEDVHLLDGGFGAWSGATESGANTASRGDYAAAGSAEVRVDADWVAARLSDDSVTLVDARTQAEYDAGHIPGALSIDWMRNVNGAAYKPLNEVEALYAEIDRSNTVVAYCQSGTRASLTWVTLKWLGFEDVRLYDGSWAEWGSRSDLPRQ